MGESAKFQRGSEALRALLYQCQLPYLDDCTMDTEECVLRHHISNSPPNALVKNSPMYVESTVRQV